MPATRRSLAGAGSISASAPVAKAPARRVSTAPKKSKTIDEMIPSTCTPYYVPAPVKPAAASSSASTNNSTDLRRKSLKGKAKATDLDGPELSQDDKVRLLQEMLGFHPRTVVEDIAEACRKQVYSIVSSVDNWANMTHGRPVGSELTEDEVSDLEQGPHRLETLLESHMDSACDKFTAWCLRNTFNVPDDLWIAMPWHEGLDFERAAYIANSAEGEEGIQNKVDDLRAQVVEMRKLKARLELANKKLDKQVTGLELEKDAAGFVLEGAEEAGLAPLPRAAETLGNLLQTLSNKLEPVDTVVPSARPVHSLPESSSGTTAGAKVWEHGRAAYLNWAVTKTTEGGDPSATKSERERVELERMKNEVEGVAEAEALGKLADGLNAA